MREFACRSRRAALGGLLAVALLAVLPAVSGAQSTLRVATWNVTDYTGGRNADFQTAIYGSFNGRSMAPDVLVGQEFVSQSAVNNFVNNILNAAPSSPGDWAAAPFIDGPGTDTESVLFYRTSKITYLATSIVAAGTSSTQDQPRNTYRYDLRVGTGASAPLLDIYSVHLKSGAATDTSSSTAATNGQRRLLETQRIRKNAAGLGANVNYLVAGDYNIQSSNEAAYQELVSNTNINGEAGRVFDPINAPGTWNNNSAFRYIHTQDPASQMDDRLDQILISRSLFDGVGLDYIGKFAAGQGPNSVNNPFVTYNETTYDDPNHSYRVWGNDGTSYNKTLTIAGNQQVGATIAQALVNSIGTSSTGGHLPVFADFRVAPVPEWGMVPSSLLGCFLFGAGWLARRRRASHHQA